LLEGEYDNNCDYNINNNASNNAFKKNESSQKLWPANPVYFCTSDMKVSLIYLAILEKLLNDTF
jgi:hypothetical protein